MDTCRIYEDGVTDNCTRSSGAEIQIKQSRTGSSQTIKSDVKPDSLIANPTHYVGICFSTSFFIETDVIVKEINGVT